MNNSFLEGLIFGFGFLFVIFIGALFISVNVPNTSETKNESKEEVVVPLEVVPFRNLQVDGSCLREFEPRPGVLCYEGYQKLSCVKE